MNRSMTQEQINEMTRRAKESLKAIEEGRVLSLDEFKKRNREWLNDHYGR